MRLIMTTALIMLICSIFAIPVTQNQATQAAQNWTNVWAPADFTTRMIDKISPLEKEGNTVMYLVEYTNGFVLLSADDACKPIIGYGYNTLVNGIENNPSFNEFIENHKNEINTIQNQRLDNATTVLQWQALLNNQISRNETRSMRPLLNTTWNQGSPYNMYCPTDAAGPGGRVWAGCVATAMAQVMKYWNWPATGTGSHTYHPAGYPTQTANFAATTYLWDDMPNSVGEPNSAVGTLLWHLGISVNMMYSPDGSGAYSNTAASALRQYFRYNSGLSLKSKDDYTADEWDALCRQQLDNAIPMYYDGSGDGGGHAFVCDGYQNTNYFHFNWGWSGAYDGYYYLNNLNPGYEFNDGQDVITNIMPLNYNPSMAQVALSGMDCSVGDTVPIAVTNYPILSTWNIQNISFVMVYDNTKMTFVGTDTANTMVEGADITTQEIIPGFISCTIMGTSAFIGGGTMIKLKFQPTEPGNYDFVLNDVMLNNSAVTTLQQTSINVSALVNQPQDSVIDLLNSMHIPLNDMATIPVNTTFVLPNWNVQHISFLVQYPINKVSWDSYDVTDCLLSTANINVENVYPGVLSFDITNTQNLFGSGTLLKLKFIAIGNTTTSTVATITVSDFYYGAIQVLNLQPGYIVLSPATGNEDNNAAILENQFSIAPNPFRNTVKLNLQLTKQNQDVTINVYNIRGQLVKSFPTNTIKSNSLELNWDGKDSYNQTAPAGVYLINVKAGDFCKTRKLVKY
jgi:hypothetical protein